MWGLRCVVRSLSLTSTKNVCSSITTSEMPLNKNAKAKQCFSTKSSFSETLCLPRTDFPMRANASKRERLIQKNCFDGLYKRLLEREGPTFLLHDGPPFANGQLHMGHVLNKVLKDVIVRYKAVTGYCVAFVPGWDCHGLPIEAKAISASKNGRLTARSDPLRIRKEARRFAESAIKIQKEDFMRLGVLADWEHPYFTMNPDYEAKQVYLFLRMMQSGLVQRRYRPVYWSPSSRTALAEAEIEYDEHTSKSVFVKLAIDPHYKLHKALKDDVTGLNNASISLAIWTTTPWTLPANQAVAVNQSLDYAIVKLTSKGDATLTQLQECEHSTSVPQSTTQEYSKHGTSFRQLRKENSEQTVSSLLVVAKNCLPNCVDFLPSTSKVLCHIKGEDLLESTYIHPFQEKRSCPIIHADFVTSDSGIHAVLFF